MICLFVAFWSCGALKLGFKHAEIKNSSISLRSLIEESHNAKTKAEGISLFYGLTKLAQQTSREVVALEVRRGLLDTMAQSKVPQYDSSSISNTLSGANALGKNIFLMDDFRVSDGTGARWQGDGYFNYWSMIIKDKFDEAVCYWSLSLLYLIYCVGNVGPAFDDGTPSNVKYLAYVDVWAPSYLRPHGCLDRGYDCSNWEADDYEKGAHSCLDTKNEKVKTLVSCLKRVNDSSADAACIYNKKFRDYGTKHPECQAGPLLSKDNNMTTWVNDVVTDATASILMKNGVLITD